MLKKCGYFYLNLTLSYNRNITWIKMNFLIKYFILPYSYYPNYEMIYR